MPRPFKTCVDVQEWLLDFPQVTVQKMKPLPKGQFLVVFSLAEGDAMATFDIKESSLEAAFEQGAIHAERLLKTFREIGKLI